MTSAASYAGTSRIPYQHSTVAPSGQDPPPRGSHCHRHESAACLPDVTHREHHRPSAPAARTAAAPSPSVRTSQQRHAHRPLSALDLPSARRRQQQQPSGAAARPISSISFLTADKVESKTKSAVSSKSKAHSRLASFGRQRLRGIVSTSDAPPQGETLPRVPVSPSDASSHHKRSDASTRSNTSSETTLTDDAKSDIKCFDERPNIVDTATWLDGENAYDLDEYERLLKRSPRMMHQTSSKLLRMTDDERPFTRVCLVPLFL